ncbi:MAG: TetR/AcrR family transcriptional regulator [Pseudomonadales bacterium]|nr:TetR/AcrR family transcriptional regulator [Pseudomonadales bacterium]
MAESTSLPLLWDNSRKTETSAAQQRIIWAAQTCYAEKGIKQTTINDIANEANITRRTVYRHFSSHDEILLVVFERVVETFWQDLYRDLNLHGDFGECLAQALLYSINYAKTAERHGYMFSNDGQAITNNIYISNTYFIEASHRGLNGIYQKKKAEGLASSNLNIEMLAEWFNRLILSFLSTPSQVFQSDEDLLRLFRHMLAPVCRANYTIKPED